MIYTLPTNPRPVLFADDATLTGRHFIVESLLVVTAGSKTLTLPTPTRELAGKATYICNNSTGSTTIVGTLVSGSSDTLLTKDTVICVCLPVAASTYKWHLLGLNAAAAGLQEAVEDYIGEMFRIGTHVGLTVAYDDATSKESIAVTYGTEPVAVSSSTSGTAGVANTASRGDHGHDLSAHTHTGATDGGTIAHTALTAIGTTTHAQIDTHVANTGATVHGLGTMSTQNAGTVAITGGTITGVAITGITDVTVPDGGTGASTFTDGGILLGSGAAAITALGQATNGQLPIGATGLDPILATITAGDGIDVTNASGAITVATDVKANSGIVIDTTELSLDLSASGITGTLAVGDGGTGVATIADGGIMLGSAAAAISTLALTTGQVPIGVTGSDPVGQVASATPSAAALIPITNGAGKLAAGFGGAASTLATLNGSIKVVEDPANATATPTASKIVIADGSGKVDGWISAATAATPGLVEHLNWGDYVPTWVWGTADPTGSVVMVGRYMHVGNMVTFYCSFEATDGNDGTLTSVTLPVAPTDTNTLIPLRGQQKVNASWTDCLPFIDATTSLNIQLHTAAVCTDAEACAYYISGSYEVAAT